MRLVRIEEFQALFSQESRPTLATVRGWILDPDVPTVTGRKIGRCWFTDIDHFRTSTDDPLADKILRAAA